MRAASAAAALSSSLSTEVWCDLLSPAAFTRERCERRRRAAAASQQRRQQRRSGAAGARQQCRSERPSEGSCGSGGAHVPLSAAGRGGAVRSAGRACRMTGGTFQQGSRLMIGSACTDGLL
eukprot:TRINITY_DN4162_c1_g1_i6.p1 TRINITY_DN4162_c1_g1~~TRINITY_DN4162_c1_g1_i6.p1  ORF type:complete len:121 (-),score=22.38 TRINITY_DN4162_c1_g1_i6:1102-1464(-)